MRVVGCVKSGAANPTVNAANRTATPARPPPALRTAPEGTAVEVLSTGGATVGNVHTSVPDQKRKIQPKPLTNPDKGSIIISVFNCGTEMP